MAARGDRNRLRAARRLTGRAVMAVALGLAPTGALCAQQTTSIDPIDRIAAVVGDRPILLSEVDEAITAARAQGLQIPEDTAALRQLRRQVLDNLIDAEVLYQRARRDTTINVTDAEVQSGVDQQYRQVRGQFHSEPEFLTALRGEGWTSPEEWRRWLADQTRRQAYTQRFMQRQKQEGKLRAGTISDAEMRHFYDDAQRANQLPQTPPTITFRQIVVSPRPSDAARRTALTRADSVKTAIEHGADFSALARQYSDDPGSKDNGGDLGFFRRGVMTRPFEEVAFQLRPGIVSPVVQTEFGYHLIIVDRINPGEIKARHILFAPVITSVESQAARARADTVVARLRAGGNFDQLVGQWGDSAEQRTVGPVLRDSLSPGYREALSQAEAGAIVGPAMLSPDTPDRTRWLVAQVVTSLGAHTATFEELRDQIRSQMIEQKGLRNLLDDLRKRTYVDIRL